MCSSSTITRRRRSVAGNEMKILSIDPSVGNIGVAIVHERWYEHSYTFKTNEKKDLPLRLTEISEHFSKYLIENTYGIDQVIVEQPGKFMREGKRGLKNVLPIQILMMSIGAIVGILGQGFPVEFVRVEDWKGKKGKKIIQQWAYSECEKHLNTHEAEAFIMALQWRSKVRYTNAVRKARGKSRKEKGNDV